MTDLSAALRKIEEGIAMLRVVEGYEIDAHDIQKIIDPLWDFVEEKREEEG